MPAKILSIQNNPTILDLLQTAVNQETTSQNMYWSRAAFWKGMGFKKLAKYYRWQSEEKHAKLSADRMVFLGRQPEVNPQPIPAVSGSIKDQFTEDLQVESRLADMYGDAILIAADLKDYVTEDIWRQVPQGTEEHEQWLEQQIEQLELVGEETYISETWM